MMKILKDFFREEDGLGTVEIVLIIAVLVGLALIFKNAIVKFVNSILGNIEGQENEFNPENVFQSPIFISLIVSLHRHH